MSGMNPWMHLLSEILPTEAFIIAGTSLDEPDLEYYLSYRNKTTPRTDRGPSLLIEPHPNAVTIADCKRHGLTLIEGTFEQFLAWLRSEFPLPPTISDLLLPQTVNLFGDTVQPGQALRFYSDFQAVPAAEEPLPPQPSRFMNGREPAWEDINRHFDIERQDNTGIGKAVDQAFSDSKCRGFILPADEPGTGKSTTIKRVAHRQVMSGRVVLAVNTASRIDVRNAIDCLSQAVWPILLLVDGFADHSEQIADILSAPEIKVRLVVLASERIYRMNYVEATAGHVRRTARRSSPLQLDELSHLIERYRRYGLVADASALRKSERFAKTLLREPVAVAICRVLNDFRPLETIVESLCAAASEADHFAYLCVALSHYCYAEGIAYSILYSAVGRHYPLSPLFGEDKPLRITENATHDDYVVPLQSVIGERVLRHAVTTHPKMLQACFTHVARSLSPHVNRISIMRRTPESRLAGRLFDADKVVRPLLNFAAEDFYVSVLREWQWNSRYWEQRALLILDSRPDEALGYARHAVAIEEHPHPLTTLGKVLLARMTGSGITSAAAFAEIFQVLSNAINTEAKHSRITVHPYSTLLAAVAQFLGRGGILTQVQTTRLLTYISTAENEFPGDPMIEKQIEAVRRIL